MSFKFHTGTRRAGLIAQAVLLSLAAPASGTARAQTTVTIDNGSPGFTANPAAWTSSTSGSATFLGGDHLVAPALPSGAVIDNTSALFSSTGGWTASTNATDFFGTNFFLSSPIVRSPYHYPISIVDNSTPSNGNDQGSSQWPTSTALPGYYGADYTYMDSSVPASWTRKAQFRLKGRTIDNLSETRQARLYAHWPASATNATNAIVRVRANSAQIAQFTVNQRISSGEWALLGSLQINNGASLEVEFDATSADGRVIADAIKLEAQDGYTANTAKWMLPNVQSSQKYDVYARWPVSQSPAFYASWSAVGSEGTSYTSAGNYEVNPRYAAGAWKKIGSAKLNGTQANYVMLEDSHLSGETLAADAVAYVRQSTFPIAKWEVFSEGRPTDVYVRWAADATRAAEARYLVTTRSGPSCSRATTSVIVDQRNETAAAGTFLGTFTATGCIGSPPDVSVELMPNSGNGSLSADAVTFVMH